MSKRRRWTCEACARREGVPFDYRTALAAKGWCGTGRHHVDRPIRYLAIDRAVHVEALPTRSANVIRDRFLEGESKPPAVQGDLFG